MAYIEKYYLEDINNQDTTFIQFDESGNDGNTSLNRLGGGGGNSGQTGGGGTDTTPNRDITPEGDKDKSTKLGNNLDLIDEYTIQITTEFLEGAPDGATVFVNGNPLPNQTPKEYKVKLSTLFNSGPQTIEVRKSDYISNQKYILEVIGTGAQDVQDVTLLEDPVSREILGINKLQLDVRYFEDGQEKTFFLRPKGTLVSLPFILAKNPSPKQTTEKRKLNINVIGPASSVQLLSNNEEDLLDSGEDLYEDVIGTKYFIKSPNTTLYRISEVVITDIDGNSELLTAGNTESISMEIILNKDLNVTIKSHRVVKKKVLKPLIRLKSASTKQYNINDKTDIPLIIEKNEDVRAISVVIGKEILEFDNLKQGRYVGINIPHRLIDKIGKYNIKLFPYAISELQKGQKEVDTRDLPPPPPPKTNPNIVEERPVLKNTQQESDTSLPPVRKDKYLPPAPVRPTNNVVINGAPNNDSDTGFSRQPGGRS